MSNTRIDKSKVAKSLYNHYGLTVDSNLSSEERLLVNKAIGMIDKECRKGTKRPSREIEISDEPWIEVKRPRNATTTGTTGENADLSGTGLENPQESGLAEFGDSLAELDENQDPNPHVELDDTNSPSDASISSDKNATDHDSSIRQFHSEEIEIPPTDSATLPTPPILPIADLRPTNSRKVTGRFFTKELYKKLIKGTVSIDLFAELLDNEAFKDDCDYLVDEMFGDNYQLGEDAIQVLENGAIDLVKALYKNILLRRKFEGKSLGTLKRNLVIETLGLWEAENSVYFENLRNYL